MDLGEGPLGLTQVLDDVGQDDVIEVPVGKRQLGLGRREQHPGVAHTDAREVLARPLDVGFGDVYADYGLALGSEQRQEVAEPGADVEDAVAGLNQRLDGLVAPAHQLSAYSLSVGG